MVLRSENNPFNTTSQQQPFAVGSGSGDSPKHCQGGIGICDLSLAGTNLSQWHSCTEVRKEVKRVDGGGRGEKNLEATDDDKVKFPEILPSPSPLLSLSLCIGETMSLGVGGR